MRMGILALALIACDSNRQAAPARLDAALARHDAAPAPKPSAEEELARTYVTHLAKKEAPAIHVVRAEIDSGRAGKPSRRSTPLA